MILLYRKTHVNNYFRILCDFINILKKFVAFLRIVLYYVIN
uniref:Uncharacterized protein n=2 Tax=unclassified Caudoviricetes TaxID=2788787 RepID=A0A8S5MSB9_9CAUD|nr:MAG TPA: hypothetical protein [Siphoviridae sp. ctckx14]DAD85225.1 MAG TPA: hypothetical protein [Siphoviridae sp. ctT3f41]DAT19394.1 MAG TPA: hypothetical protein [Caudoviricetes sp.]DAV15507.1 MAG TPA: hypothetical protein [Caudoviricetes sp.]